MKGDCKRRIFILIAVLTIIFVIYPPFVISEMQVDYVQEDYSAGNHFKVFASYRENLTERNILTTYEKPGESRIFLWDWTWRSGDYIKRVDPIDYYLDYFEENDILISGIKFYTNGFYAGEISGSELLNCFTPNEQVEIYETENGELGIHVLGEDSQLTPTAEFRLRYSQLVAAHAKTGAIYFLLLLCFCWLLAELFKKYAKNEGPKYLNVTDKVIFGIISLVIIGVLIGAFTSDINANPDEVDSVYAVKYYFTHLFPPDVRDLEEKAFSLYGVTRLSELNLYYILAANIACFFTFENASRFFSVFMLAGLFYLLITNFRKNRYLLCTLLLTPQIWYLHTYCTSDALDFVVAVLVLYQLVNPESTLQQLTKNGIRRKDGGKLLLLGFLFANIFMSKANYYVIAIYAFAMLFTEIIYAPKEDRKNRFISCLWIAGATFMILGIRYIPEFIHYGADRSSIIMEIRNQIAIPELKLNSPPEVQSAAINLYGKGVSFKEFLFERGLNETLFCSFSGTYGGLKYKGPDWYYWAQGILYILLYMGTAICIWKDKGYREQKIKFILLNVCGLISYALVLYNAYFIDFQAQGRYMLPVLIFIAHAVSLKREIAYQKWFQIIICSTAVLSFWSYTMVCLPNILPK